MRIITASGVFAPTGAVTFVAVRADSLVVRLDPNTWSVPIAAVTKLEVSRGRNSFGAGRGALIGVLVGGVAGWIVGYAGYEECVPSGGLFDCAGVFSPEVAAFGGAMVLGTLGAGIGAVTGALVKTHRWVEVPLDRLRVSLAPQRDGRFAFGLSVRF